MVQPYRSSFRVTDNQYTLTWLQRVKRWVTEAASKRYLGLSISLKQIGNPSQRLTLLQVSQTLEEGCDHKIIREAPPAARELVQPPDEVSNE